MKKEQNCRLGKVGGQAVLEGVMMKSGDDIALAVRKEDGTIEVKRSKHVSIRKKHKLLNIPLIRGCVNMVETLIMSMGTLEDSANMIGLDETEDETKFEKWLRKVFGDKLMNVIMGIGMVLGVILSVGLIYFFSSSFTAIQTVSLLNSGEYFSVQGNIEDLVIEEFWLNGSDVPNYDCSFVVNGVEFPFSNYYTTEEANALKGANEDSDIIKVSYLLDPKSKSPHPFKIETAGKK
jgi:hypothetical protein